ncbi:hypothetical protein, partial [Treponema sp. R6D11]
MFKKLSNLGLSLIVLSLTTTTAFASLKTVESNGKTVPAVYYGTTVGDKTELTLNETGIKDVYKLETVLYYNGSLAGLQIDVDFDETVLELVKPNGSKANQTIGLADAYIPNDFTDKWATPARFDGDLYPKYDKTMLNAFGDNQDGYFSIHYLTKTNVNEKFNPTSEQKLVNNNDLICPKGGLILGNTYFKLKSGKSVKDIKETTFKKNEALAKKLHVWHPNAAYSDSKSIENRIEASGADIIAPYGSVESATYN